MERKWIKFVIILLFLSVFIFIGSKVKGSSDGIFFDEQVLKTLDESATPFKTSLIKVISFFGSYKFLLPAGFFIFLFLFINRDWVGIIFLTISLIGGFGMNTILKYYYVRVRPIQYFLIEKTGFSFPSGHAMVSMTFYTMMTYLITSRRRNKKSNASLWVVNFIIIILIGYSRLYLGVHWPTDIIGGYIMGGLINYLTITNKDKIHKISLRLKRI